MTSRKSFERLFSPLQLKGGKTLINRALMGSVCLRSRTGRACAFDAFARRSPTHVVFDVLQMHSGLEEGTGMAHSLEKMAAFFEERARGRVGLMVTGGIAPNSEVRTWLARAHARMPESVAGRPAKSVYDLSPSRRAASTRSPPRCSLPPTPRATAS